MAKINFNFWASDYDHRITVMSDTLLAAEEALDAKSQQIADEAAAYEADIAAGSVDDDVVYDDDTGSVIYRRSSAYDYDLDVIDQGLVALRKSFVISLYHLWERTAKGWSGASTANEHSKFLKAVRAKDVNPPERLEHIYFLNNVLKHNSRKHGPKLLTAWPEIFVLPHMLQKQLDEGKVRIEWSERLAISKGAMAEIFAVIRASGPK